MGNEKINCLLCNSDAELKHNSYPGYQKPHTFIIYHCNSCKTAFSLPRMDTTSVYENIYKNGDKVPGYNRYWKYAGKIKNKLKPLNYLASEENTYWGVKESLDKMIKNKDKTKILEIGSGLGYLTFSLIKENFNVVGLDISQTAVNKSIKDFGNYFICDDLFEYAQRNIESYDVVILTEVIEHVDNPLDFISAIIKLLKKGGSVIITTPNRSIYPAEIVWASDIPPVHWWWFSENSIEYIAKQLKLEIEFVDFSVFHKKNHQTVYLNNLIDNKLPNPYFDQKGEIIVRNQKDSNFNKLRSFIANFKFLKNKYGQFRDIFIKDKIICKERSTVLCAILKKSV
jgi:SAM-dependent methyltransferase